MPRRPPAPRPPRLSPLLALPAGAAAAGYCMPGSPCWPSATKWEALGEELSGGSEDLTEVTEEMYNECYEHKDDARGIRMAAAGVCMQYHDCNREFCDHSRKLNLPAYTVAVRVVADIQAVVAFGRANRVAVTVKTSGHNYAGSSTGAGSILVWMAHFQKATDAGVAPWTDSCGTDHDAVLRVGGGQVWEEAYLAAAAADPPRDMVGGGGLTVSAAGGWLQGGGLAATHRLRGLGVDNVVSFEVVLADGSHVTADACAQTDLFWALRGGGGGTFGVVTAARHRTHPTGAATMLRVAVLPGVAEMTGTPPCVDHDQAVADYFRGTPDTSDDGITTCAILASIEGGCNELVTAHQTCPLSCGNCRTSCVDNDAQIAATTAASADPDDDWVDDCTKAAAVGACDDPNVRYVMCPVRCVSGCGARADGGYGEEFFAAVEGWLRMWVEVSPTLDRRWGGYWDLHGNFDLFFIGSVEDAEATLGNRTDAWLAGKPYAPMIYRSPMKASSSYWEARGRNANTDLTGMDRVEIRSRLVPRDWVVSDPDAVIETLLQLATRPGLGFTGSYILGGAVADVGADATAMHPAVRSAVWTINMGSGDAETSESAMELLRQRTEGSGACFNHASKSEPGWGSGAFWGDNTPRLREIKAAVDPDGVFNCWHCVGYSGPDLLGTAAPTSPSAAPAVSTPVVVGSTSGAAPAAPAPVALLAALCFSLVAAAARA